MLLLLFYSDITYRGIIMSFCHVNRVSEFTAAICAVDLDDHRISLFVHKLCC